MTAPAAGRGRNLRRFFNSNPLLATALVISAAMLPPFAVHAAGNEIAAPPARAVISAGPVSLDRQGNPVAVHPTEWQPLARQSGTSGAP